MPGFDEQYTKGRESSSNNDGAFEIVNEMSDEELTTLIETNLKSHNEEEIVWIYNEFLFFKNSLQDRPRENLTGFLRVRDFLEFNAIKQNLIQSLKKLKQNEIYSFFDKIKQNEDKYTFPTTLKEIKNNKRLCAFIFNFIKNKNEKLIVFEYHNNIYLHLIHLYFTNKMHSDRKTQKIEDAIKEFNNEIKLKNKNRSKNLEDESFLNWAYSYLKRTNHDFNEIVYIPTNQKSYQNLITTYLDYLSYFENILYENLMNKLNKAWSQKKFRDGNKTKKLYHLPLTKNAKKELQELSVLMNMSENAILEKLIHENFLENFRDENGKSIF
jgi:hypothetical protein